MHEFYANSNLDRTKRASNEQFASRIVFRGRYKYLSGHESQHAV